MMKRFSVLTLALLLLFSAFTFSMANEETIVWNSVSLTKDGKTVPTDSSWNMKLTLNADNTALIEYSWGSPDKGEWFDAGSMIGVFKDKNGDLVTFSKTLDGNLTYDLSGIIVNFESDTPQESSVIELLTNKLIGTWEGQTISLNGFTVPLSTVGISMLVTISDDESASIVFNGEKPDKGKWSVSGNNLLVSIGKSYVSFGITSDYKLTYVEDAYTIALERK